MISWQIAKKQNDLCSRIVYYSFCSLMIENDENWKMDYSMKRTEIIVLQKLSESLKQFNGYLFGQQL